MKTLKFIRDWWIRMQLSAPPSVQRTVMPRLHEAKEIARLLAKPYLPVYQLQGQGQGGPLSVTFIGWEYAKPVLQDLLFVEKPLERKIGRIPFWHHSRLTSLSSSDVVIVATAEYTVSRLPCQNAIVLPEFVRHILDVRGDWQSVRNRFRKTVHRNDLPRIRKYGYEYDITHDPKDFQEFYYDMYVPTMRNRHNDLSVLMPISEAYQYFRCGHLFRIERCGVWVSGGLCHQQQDTLMLDIVGVRNGDTRLIQEGAMSARYYAAIHWANHQGLKAVDFLGTDPYLKSGMFQSKRKWGTVVYVPSHLHRQIWIRVNRNTPAVCQFLKENPFIAIDEDDQLYGLIFVDDSRDVPAETRQEWESHYATPGLSSLVIRSVSNFVEPATSNPPDLVIPIPCSISGENSG